MALDAKKLRKPFRNLRKSLKRFPERPTPEQVHDLRTNSRKLEAVIQALAFDGQPRGRRLLKTVAPVRKNAGKVRDMDVLTALTSTLALKGEEECLVQLLEHLTAKRARSVKKLLRIIEKQRSQARALLQYYSSAIEKCFGAPQHDAPQVRQWPALATATALQLSRELANWPYLRRDNLHPYRLRIKQLRYVLQLRDDPDDEFVGALGDAKDAIGEWHDWSELESIAAGLLKHRSQCKLLPCIRSTVRQKLQRAISLSSQLKQIRLDTKESGHPGSRQKAPRLSEPVILASARLAA